MTIPAIDETVAKMKAEILADARAGRFAARPGHPYADGKIASFGDLHSYVDANEYGGFCEDGGITDALIAHHGGERQIGAILDAWPPEVSDYFNACQDAVNDWIVSGQFAKELAE